MHDRFVRLAFKRFAIDGDNEMAHERLHDALVHMGFLTSTRERALELATELSNQRFDHRFDYADFCEFVTFSVWPITGPITPRDHAIRSQP